MRQAVERFRRSAIIRLRAGAEATVTLMDKPKEAGTFRTKGISLPAYFNHLAATILQASF